MIPTEQQLANRKAWLDALRSGKYEQGKSQLRSCTRMPDDYSYCCLGVDAELGDELTPDGCVKSTNSSSYPDELWFANRHGIPKHAARKFTRECADLNDLRNFTFPEIADKIEAMLGELDAEESAQ